MILTTPLSLIAFLRTVSSGWTQVRVNQNAIEIRNVARKLHERLSTFLSDFSDVGSRLAGAVRSFNTAVGRQRGIQSSLRTLEELGVESGSAPTEVTTIDQDLRECRPIPQASRGVPLLEKRPDFEQEIEGASSLSRQADPV